MRMTSLFAAGIVVIATGALAHDRWGNPNWIANGHFTSPIDGSHCCGVNDCVQLEDDIVHPNGVGYEVNGLASVGNGNGATYFLINETVPYRETQASRDGKYWRCHKPDNRAAASSRRHRRPDAVRSDRTVQCTADRVCECHTGFRQTPLRLIAETVTQAPAVSPTSGSCVAIVNEGRRADTVRSSRPAHAFGVTLEWVLGHLGAFQRDR